MVLKRQSKSFVLVTVMVTVLVLFTLTMLFASHVIDFSLKKREATKAIENRLVAEMALDTISDWFCAKAGELISDEDFISTTPKKNPEIAVPNNFFVAILSCYGERTITAEITDCYYDDEYAETARPTAVPQIEPTVHEDEIELSFHIYISVKDNDGNVLNAVRMIKSIKNTVTNERQTFVAETYFL